MIQQDRCLWLIRELLKGMPQYRDTPIPMLPEQRWQLLRSLMNVRLPMPVTEEFCRIQDAFLQEMTEKKGIVDGKDLTPCPKDERLLASCYRSCLTLAAENDCENIAFCCISTGVFRFPASRAAEIAVQTVKDFLKKESSIRRVIFNVFKDSDLEIYQRLLS